MTRSRLSAATWLFVLVVACAGPRAPAGDEPTAIPQPSGDRQTDRASIERLEQEARALANASGCAGSAQCRAAPVGAKACGGPRYWLVYCPLTSDSAALLRKLEELRAAEQAFNQKYGVLSDCAFVTEPNVESVGGTCRTQ